MRILPIWNIGNTVLCINKIRFLPELNEIIVIKRLKCFVKFYQSFGTIIADM